MISNAGCGANALFYVEQDKKLHFLFEVAFFILTLSQTHRSLTLSLSLSHARTHTFTLVAEFPLPLTKMTPNLSSEVIRFFTWGHNLIQNKTFVSRQTLIISHNVKKIFEKNQDKNLIYSGSLNRIFFISTNLGVWILNCKEEVKFNIEFTLNSN